MGSRAGALNVNERQRKHSFRHSSGAPGPSLHVSKTLHSSSSNHLEFWNSGVPLAASTRSGGARHRHAHHQPRRAREGARLTTGEYNLMKFVILLLQSGRLPDPLPGYEHGINPDSSSRDLRREVRFKLTEFDHGRGKMDDPQLHARRDCWPSGWRGPPVCLFFRFLASSFGHRP